MKKIKSIKDIEKIVKWFCKQFSLDELTLAAGIILAVLNNERKDIKCKETSEKDLPNYRKFYVNPIPPLTQSPKPKDNLPIHNYKQLLEDY